MPNPYGGSTPAKRTTSTSKTPARKAFKNPKNQRAYESYVRAKRARKETPRSAQSWWRNVRNKPKGISKVLGSVGRGVKRGWKDISSIGSVAVRDVTRLGASAFPGGMTPSRAWKQSELVRPLAKEVQAVPQLFTPKIDSPEEAAFRRHPSISTFSKLPLARLTPGMYTAGQLSRGKKGLKELGAHPGFALADIAPYFKVARAAKLGTKTAKVLGETKAGIRLESVIAPVREHVSLKGAKSAAEFAIERRRATKQVHNALRDVIDRRPEKLSRAERMELLEHARTGTRPTGKLEPYFNDLEQTSRRQAQAGLDWEIPDEMDALLREKSLTRRPTGKGELGQQKITRTAIERMKTGLGKKIGDEQASSVVDDMVAAFRNRQANPHPQYTKAWNNLTRGYRQSRRSLEQSMKLYPEPATGDVVSWAERQNIFRSMQRLQKQRPKSNANAGLAKIVDYYEAVRHNPPAKWRYLTREATEAADAVLAQADAVPGLGPGWARNQIADIVNDAEANIFALQAKGIEPVYLPSRAVSVGEGALEPRVGTSFGQVAARKAHTGAAEFYSDDAPHVLLLDSQAELAVRDTSLKALGRVYEREGSTFDTEVQKLIDAGMDATKANEAIRRSFQTFDYQRGKLVFSEPSPGDVVLPRYVTKAVRFYTEPAMSKGQRFLQIWMIPTLALSPVFQANNILGGSMATALRTSLNPRLFRDVVDAWRAAMKGESLFPELPAGFGFAPRLGKWMDLKDELRASFIHGQGLKAVASKLNPVRLADRANHFMDQFYRDFITLNKLSSGRSLDEALMAGRRLMQDWDSMTAVEREWISRIIPFWSWKRSLIRTALTYPMDHPLRTSVLNWAAREEASRKEASAFLDAMLANWMPLTNPDSKGFRLYLSLRGMNPYADYANMGTVAGWVQSSHPLFQAALRFFGVDTFAGGIPDWDPDRQLITDPETGFSYRATDPRAIAELIPQARAALMAGEDIDDTTLRGVVDWLEKYGAAARLVPGMRYWNLSEKQRKYLERRARAKALREGEVTQFLAPAKGASRKSLESRGVLKPRKKKASTRSSGGINPY
jgi:hypothetical protein